MAGVPIFLCVCLCLQLVVGQFGFFPQRGERARPSPFGIAQNLFPNANGVRNALNNIFNFGRQPSNQYDQNRPINNNQFIPNRPFNNNQYDPNRPINNNQYDFNRPINNNQFDQYRPDYPYNQPNDVRFPNQDTAVIEVIEVPYEEINSEQPRTTNNPIQPEPIPEFVNQPNDVPKEDTGYGFQNNGGNTNEEHIVTNTPIENSMNFDNEPTSSPLGYEQDGQSEDPFGNKNGIPTVPPPQFTTKLPQLTPVPPSESRNNFNFGSAGIFSNNF